MRLAGQCRCARLTSNVRPHDPIAAELTPCMPKSLSYLFKSAHEFVPVAELSAIPRFVRGLYVLYKATGKQMEVVYVGMARGERTGVKGRLQQHRSTKDQEWTHASVFEVWDNIPAEQVEELEGLFRHIYRLDPQANRLNKQRAYKPFQLLAKESQHARKKSAA